MTSTQAREITTIEELVQLSSLVDIRPYEFAGRVAAAPAADVEDPIFQLSYSQRTEPTELEDRFLFHTRTADAEYVVELGAVYQLAEECAVPEAIRVDFAERIGFMVIFPLVRELLSSAGSRLHRNAPLLNFVRPGDVKIEWPGAEDTSTAEAG